MRRSLLPVAVAAGALAACGALVGVQDLEVVGDASPTKPDARAPSEAGAVFLVDAGGVGTDGGVTRPPLSRPLPGKYTYTITGRDGLAGTFGTTNEYTAPATVDLTYEGDDCFTEAFHIRDGYDETVHLCRQGATFAMDRGNRSQTLVNTNVKTVLTCTPGDVYIPQVPSTSPYAHFCTGHNEEQKSQDGNSNFTTAGDYIFVGVEQVAISGASVEVVHFHDARNVSGSQTGTNVAEWYFAAKSGVLVRLERDIDVHYKFGFINTEYVEHLDMTLAAPPP